MKKRSPTAILLAIVLLLLYAGYVIYPFGATLLQSIRSGPEYTLGHYLSLFDPSTSANLEAVWNSVLVSLLSVAFSGAVGLLLAVTFTGLRFPLSPVLARLAVMPVALPPLVGVIAFLFVFGESGIIPRALQTALGTATPPCAVDGIPAIVLVHVYSFYVYFYLFCSTALRQIDGSLLEAAAGLGSSPWRTFRRVILPSLRPALVGASLLTFMASMASFSAPLIFAGGQRFVTLQIYTTKLNGDLPLAAAQSVLLALVSVLFFIILLLGAGGQGRTRGMKGSAAPGVLMPGAGGRMLLIAGSCGVLFLWMLPLAAIVLVSFAREGSWTWQLLPETYTLENYARFVADPSMFEPIKNSVLMSAIAVGAGVVIGVGAAYFVGRLRSPGSRSLSDLAVTIPYAVPGTVVAIGMILAFNTPTVLSGWTVLVGTFWILPLTYMVRTYPLIVRSTAAALANVDETMVEAAQSLGAGGFRRFRRVLLPLLLPGIVSGGVLAMIASLGEFVSSVLLYAYDSRPISVEILAQLRMFSFGSAAAYCVVLLILILLLVSAASAFLRRRGSTLSF